MAEKIVFASGKGGVGKSFSCINIGVGLARTGKKVLLVDFDPQASMTIALGYSQPDQIPATISDIMTKIIEDENSRGITFYITKKGETVFEADESWRIRDLKYIGFKDESYDVLVESGDIGTSEYIVNGETWKKK